MDQDGDPARLLSPMSAPDGDDNYIHNPIRPAEGCDFCPQPKAAWTCPGCGLNLCGRHRECPECETDPASRRR